MTQRRKISANESVRVVTKNSFIQGRGMEKASLKATKLLYIAIAQCRQSDTEFYEYGLSVPEFASLMQIEPSNVYQEAEAITDVYAGGYYDADGVYHYYTGYYPYNDFGRWA